MKTIQENYLIELEKVVQQIKHVPYKLCYTKMNTTEDEEYMLQVIHKKFQVALVGEFVFSPRELKGRLVLKEGNGYSSYLESRFLANCQLDFMNAKSLQYSIDQLQIELNNLPLTEKLCHEYGGKFSF